MFSMVLISSTQKSVDSTHACSRGAIVLALLANSPTVSSPASSSMYTSAGEITAWASAVGTPVIEVWSGSVCLASSSPQINSKISDSVLYGVVNLGAVSGQFITNETRDLRPERILNQSIW